MIVFIVSVWIGFVVMRFECILYLLVLCVMNLLIDFNVFLVIVI